MSLKRGTYRASASRYIAVIWRCNNTDHSETTEMNILQSSSDETHRPRTGSLPEDNDRQAGNPATALSHGPGRQDGQHLRRLLDDFTALASSVCDTPVAMVSQLYGRFDNNEFHERRRQWWRVRAQSGVVPGPEYFAWCDITAGGHPWRHANHRPAS